MAGGAVVVWFHLGAG